MAILIALDDGHGMRTPGKRSPKLADGTVMHENEFNRKVVAYLDDELKRCGFKTLLVAPTDDDTPLSTRVKRANDKKADLYLSIHANAFNGKLDNAAGGIETFAHFNYPKTVAKAKIIHKWVMKGTEMKDRGVKNGDWLYVCRNTAMEAILVELGFMDNLHDIKKLTSNSYRKECAVELAKALCEIYDKNYKSDSKPSTSKPAATGSTYTIEKGDTFWGIEEKLNLKHGTLKKLNPKVNPKDLSVGQKIVIEDEPARIMIKTYWYRDGSEGLAGVEKYLKDHGWHYERIKEKK